MLDLDTLRQQFPILGRQIHGQRLAYLDNAATTQKPQAMLDALVSYYAQHNANVHRGVHTLSEESTDAYHVARQRVAAFFGAHEDELILTRNTTEAVNVLALGWAGQVQAGDVIAVTLLEHHSNFVPWQRLARERGARFLVLPLRDDATLDLEAADRLLGEAGDRLRVLALSQLSNATGERVPVEAVVQGLRTRGQREHTLVVLDAAQSAAHLPLDLHTLDADALTLSAHKMYGPMGMGALLLRREHIEKLEPILLGGGMINTVAPEKTAFSDSSIDRFAAGTPDVAGVVAWAAACAWLQELGWPAIQAHEQDLMQYAWEQLAARPELELVGPDLHAPRRERLGSLSFQHKTVHAHDVAQVLDRHGVAVRSGHHCTMPLHVAQHWVATTRVSFAVYNDHDDIDQLASALDEVQRLLGSLHG